MKLTMSRPCYVELYCDMFAFWNFRLFSPDCVAKGSRFSVGVWGRDRVRSDFGNDIVHVRARPRTTAHDRDMPNALCP